MATIEVLELGEALEPALGAVFRLELGRLCRYPEDLLAPVETGDGWCVLQAVGPGEGEILLECPVEGLRKVRVTVRTAVCETLPRLRAQDICL